MSKFLELASNANHIRPKRAPVTLNSRSVPRRRRRASARLARLREEARVAPDLVTALFGRQAAQLNEVGKLTLGADFRQVAPADEQRVRHVARHRIGKGQILAQATVGAASTGDRSELRDRLLWLARDRERQADVAAQRHIGGRHLDALTISSLCLG